MGIIVYNKRKKINYFDSPLWDRKIGIYPLCGRKPVVYFLTYGKARTHWKK